MPGTGTNREQVWVSPLSLQSSKEAGSKIQQLECSVLNAAVQNQQAPNRDTYVWLERSGKAAWKKWSQRRWWMEQSKRNGDVGVRPPWRSCCFSAGRCDREQRKGLTLPFAWVPAWDLTQGSSRECMVTRLPLPSSTRWAGRRSCPPPPRFLSHHSLPFLRTGPAPPPGTRQWFSFSTWEY